jgi:hypothetical protein
MDSLEIPAAADLRDCPELEHEILFLALLLEAGDRSESTDQAASLKLDNLASCFETGSQPALSGFTVSPPDL